MEPAVLILPKGTRILRVDEAQETRGIGQHQWSGWRRRDYANYGVKEQLEFKWNGRKRDLRVWSSRQRHNRCRWWFEQMRRTVDEAPEGADSFHCAKEAERPLFQNN